MCLNGLGRLALYQADLPRASQQFREALRLNFELGHHLSLTECLQELAVVALRHDQEARATRLWSAATALRERMGVSFPANDPLYRELAPEWSQAIAQTPEWRAGQSMALEQVIALALTDESMEGPSSI